MNVDEKQRLLAHYFQQPIDRVLIDDGCLAPPYDGVDAFLNDVEAAIPNLPPDAPPHDVLRHRILMNIMKHTVSVAEEDGRIKIDRYKFDELTPSWIPEIEIMTRMKDCDYYARKTGQRAIDDAELAGLVVASTARLTQVIQGFLPGFDPDDTRALQKELVKIERALGRSAPGSAEALALEDQKAILSDLQKIKSLQQINIPTVGEYCSMDDAVGGVTEKISLMSLDNARAQLGRLVAAPAFDLRAYLEHRPDYRLRTEAIIKLPKHGVAVEVQREAMALSFASLLEPRDRERTSVASNLMISCDDRPGLFVPFDDIRLLRTVAQGKTMTGYRMSLSKVEYEHYATINPLGEGLQSAQHLDDFGDWFALIYLCNDPDTFGGYLQNKALMGKHLYIFDLVAMHKTYLDFDRSLSMQPVGVTKFSRHGQGRNRSLIEDASIDKKFDSLMSLVEKQPLLMRYCDRIAAMHKKKIESLSKELKTETSAANKVSIKHEIRLLNQLRGDALGLKEILTERIERFKASLPPAPPGFNPELMKKALVLEKLLNFPRLYTEDGRPYRFPSSTRHDQSIRRIYTDSAGIHVQFNEGIPRDVKSFLMDKMLLTEGAKMAICDSPSELIMDEATLMAMNESLFYPEHRFDLGLEHRLEPGLNYLYVDELALLRKFYPDLKADVSEAVLRTVDNYQRTFASDPVNVIQQTQAALNDLAERAPDAGFAQHVLKKLQLDAQQKLQGMLPPGYDATRLNQAFCASLSLDHSQQFNISLAQVMQRGGLEDAHFVGFLDRCIALRQRAVDAHDYAEVETCSGAMQQALDTLQHTLTRTETATHALAAAGGGDGTMPASTSRVLAGLTTGAEPSLLAGANPVAAQDEVLGTEVAVLADLVAGSPTAAQTGADTLDVENANGLSA
jgi:hypothetical protein